MFGGRVQFTRDEKNSKLASSVYANLAEIASHFEPKASPVVDKFNTLPLISVEQAMQELLEIENEINQKKSEV